MEAGDIEWLRKIATGDAEDIMLSVGRTQRILNTIAELQDALKEISLGKGAFSRDPQQHANNTIENMKSIALQALKEKP